MPQIKDISITKTTAADGDFLMMQTALGETYRITKADLLAGLSGGDSGGGSPTTKQLIYTFSGDTKGALYYFGTNEGATAWGNPVNSGVAVTCNSIGSGDTSMMTDRQPSYFYTDNILNSWIKIQLPKQLKCNYYSIRNRNSNAHYLRNWKLQGSNDGTVWIDLDTQVNNTALDMESQWLSLPVSNTPAAYASFRLIQNGVNSNGANFLCLGEIELYGELIE